MTEFSPWVQLVLQAAEEVVSYARRYRKDRYWALPPDDVRPVVPEDATKGYRLTWSDDEEGVRALWASAGRVWPEQLEWPDTKECPPARRFRRPLAQGAQGGLSYEIRVYDPCDYQHDPLRKLYDLLGAQDARRKARRRLRQVLPSNRPLLQVTFTTRPDLDALRRASTAQHPPAPHVPRRLTIVIGLGERSAREQRRWRQRRQDDHKYVLTVFREWERRGPTQRSADRKELLDILEADPALSEVCARAQWVHQRDPQFARGERSGPRVLYVDESTTPEDITAALLAYLLQDEMVCWKTIAPWVQQYDPRAFDAGTSYLRMREVGLPLEANTLRPPSPPRVEPGAYSIPEATKVLGITPRQLGYTIAQEEIPGIEKHGRACVIRAEALEQLRSLVADKVQRRQDKTRRAAFSEKAQNAGMKHPAIRQMIRRGPRTPEGTPDWDALEAQLPHHSRRAKGQEPSEDAMTADDLEGLCTLLEAQYRAAQTEDERLEILDKLTHIRQRQQKGAS